MFSHVQSKSTDKKQKVLKLSGTNKAPLDEDALLSDLLGDSGANKPKVDHSWGDDWNDVKNSFVQDDDWASNFLGTKSTTFEIKVCQFDLYSRGSWGNSDSCKKNSAKYLMVK